MTGRLRWVAVLATAAALCSPAGAGAYVYWTNNAGTTIARANLDGSGVDPSFITGASQPLGVAAGAQQIYWANHGTGTIGVANLNGSSPFQQLVTGASGIGGIAVGGQYLYWSNYDSGAIGRANLDGSGANQSFIGAAPSAVQVAVDDQHVYWASLQGTIGRANLDGSGVDPSFIAGARTPYGVAVDGQHLYWSDYSTGSIGRANLDGSGVDQNFITGALYPTNVAVDSGHVYWANHGSNAIGRANLDGSGADQSFIAGATDAYGLAVDAGAPVAPPALAMTFGITRTSGSVLAQSLTCTGSAGPACGGRATITSGRHPVTLGSAPYLLTAGQSGVLRVALNARGRRMLARSYHLAAVLTLSGTARLRRAVAFSYRRIRLTLDQTWSFDGRGIRFARLTVGGVPARASVRLACRGRGCPFGRRRVSRPHRRLAVSPLLLGASLGNGAVLSIIVAAPNRVADVLVLTMRGGAGPRLRISCLAPGARRPASCVRR